MTESEILTHLVAQTFEAQQRGDGTAQAVADALYEMYDHGLVNVASYDEDGEPLFVLNEFGTDEDWQEAFEDFMIKEGC